MILGVKPFLGQNPLDNFILNHLNGFILIKKLKQICLLVQRISTRSC